MKSFVLRAQRNSGYCVFSKGQKRLVPCSNLYNKGKWEETHGLEFLVPRLTMVWDNSICKFEYWKARTWTLLFAKNKGYSNKYVCKAPECKTNWGLVNLNVEEKIGFSGKIYGSCLLVIFKLWVADHLHCGYQSVAGDSDSPPAKSR